MVFSATRSVMYYCSSATSMKDAIGLRVVDLVVVQSRMHCTIQDVCRYVGSANAMLEC